MIPIFSMEETRIADEKVLEVIFNIPGTSIANIVNLSPVYTTIFLARYPFEFGPGAKNLQPGTLHFCRANGKIRGTSAPKHTGAETTYPHGLSTRMFWGTRATHFSIYTTKMEGAGLQILGTGAKFKRVSCQKSCRVDRALVCYNFNISVKLNNLNWFFYVRFDSHLPCMLMCSIAKIRHKRILKLSLDPYGRANEGLPICITLNTKETT